MAKEHASAEKELLKIIENPSMKSKKSALTTSQSPAQKSSDHIRHKEKFKFPTDWRTLVKNKQFYVRIFCVAIFCLFVFFIVILIKEYKKLESLKKMGHINEIVKRDEKDLSKIVPKQTANQNEQEQNQATIPAPPTERNIFKPGLPPDKKAEEPKDESTIALKDYKLVGISISANPAENYAMIENAGTKTTFFLKKGEILNGAELIRIGEDKAVFRIGEKKIELR